MSLAALQTVVKLAAAPALGVLRAVPWQAWAAAAAIGVAWWWHDGRVDAARQAGGDAVRAEWATATALAVEAAASAAAANRAEEQRRAAAQQQEIDRATESLDRARADAARADRAAASLRDAARAAAARCGRPAGHPATAEDRAPADGRMLADVLAELDERAGALAAEADRRGIAGLACERAYDTLTPR
jgi:hypothetical protein